MKYINLFDQAMLLSRWEGFGLVLAEYMYARKAIIATNIDAIPDIITDNRNGLLVKVDNIEEVANASKLLKENKNLKELIVKNAKKDVETKFNIKRVVDEHYDIFAKI